MTRKKTTRSEEADHVFSETGLPTTQARETVSHDSSSADPSMTPVLTEEMTQSSEGSLVEELQRLQVELEQARAQSHEYLDGWQRSRADFANYKKRIEREQALTTQISAGNIIKRYLEIADDLERALKNRPTDGSGVSWSEGIDLIYRKFLGAFEADGVKQIIVESQFFDPNLHEAISQEDSPNHQSGQIIEAIQPGYMLGDRVLQPARVRVAR